MTLTEIFDRVMVDSGMYLFTSANLEMDADKFGLLVKRMLGIYSKYHPRDELLTLTISGTEHVFIETDPIPAWISDVIPVNNPVMLNLMAGYNEFSKMRTSFTEPDRINFIWKYVRPSLYVPMGGNYNVQAVYHHKLTAITPATTPATYEVLTIDDTDDLFFKILTGMFMQGLGRSRRAFTIAELPITSDASDMTSEGTTMVTEGMQQLQEIGSKFYLAWG